jgi:hypothetical protein
MLLSLHLKGADIGSDVEPELAAFTHSSACSSYNDGAVSWQRFVGGLDTSDSGSQTGVPLEILYKSADRLVAVFEIPTPASVVALVPFLSGIRASSVEADFDINVFPSAHISVSGVGDGLREWGRLSTFSLPWAVEKAEGPSSRATAFLQLPSPQKLAVRCVFSGSPAQRSDPAVLTVTGVGGASRGIVSSSQGATGGLCVHAAVAPVPAGPYLVEVHRHPRDPSETPPSLLLQVPPSPALESSAGAVAGA